MDDIRTRRFKIANCLANLRLKDLMKIKENEKNIHFEAK